MRTSLCAVALVLSSSLPPSPVAAQETPRAVLERAVRACGAPADQPLALRARFRLLMHKAPAADADPDDPRFMVELSGDSAGKCARLEVYDTTLEKSEFSLVVGPRGAWTLDGNQASPLNKDRFARFRQMIHFQRVTWLVPVLQDKKFELTALGESKFEGRTLVGVQVAYPEVRDVKLYFDKDTGLLTKAESEWDAKDPYTQIFREYRAIDGSEGCEKLLREAGVETDGAALLGHLRRYLPDAERAAKIAGHIEKLGDDSFDAREKATAALKHLGRPALPWLRKALRHDDLEVVQRASQVIAAVGGDGADPVTGAVVRLLGTRKPKGAAEVLLAYLTDAAGPAEAAEVRAALAAVAVRDGKADPVLLKALDEKGSRRDHAAAALGRDKGEYAARPGRRLYLPPLKIAHKIEYLEGTKPQFSMELTEVQFFNRLDERLFDAPGRVARPAEPLPAPTSR
jgi:hypothetical protein